MHAHRIPSLLHSGFIAVLLAVPTAQAADTPMRKSGLWEIKTETSVDGQKMPGPMTMQTCIDQSRDNFASEGAAPGQRCSKMNVTRAGGKTVIDSVCTQGKHTVTGHTVISGDMSSNYRMENSARFAPPMEGMTSTATVMSGKWLGACKPGQTHGSATMSGMPGMSPEMMRQMQQYRR